MNALLSLAEAQERLIAMAPRMRKVTAAIEDCLGRVLADDLVAARTQPAADLSAMDGYALSGDGPWALVGESRAGAPFARELTHGQCTRISTGAHMPRGSDRVLIQENAVVDGNLVTANAVPMQGQHVRKTGFDFWRGDAVLKAGTTIGPGQIALALASGLAALEVSERPRVALLDSGDELAVRPDMCGPGQIPASNGAMIAAMLAPLVGSVSRIGPVADDRKSLARALSEANDCDVLITSGGASVGDHDLVQDALVEWGAEIAFWKVAIKPGKPLLVARRAGQIILGLPGNPASSFVTSFLFALPLVRAAMGDPDPLPKHHALTAVEDLPSSGSRHEFLRGISESGRVRLAGAQDSSVLRSLAASNCLISRSPNARAVQAGEAVEVIPLQNG